MLTKAVVLSISANANRCTVRMPLFESASSTAVVEAEALVNIPPGVYNNLSVGDVVFVGFEENAIEKPIILGKLFKGITDEGTVTGGAGRFDTLNVNHSASIPAATTTYRFDPMKDCYKQLETPKKVADYIIWLEGLTKDLISQLDGHFRCFKNWTQFQFKPENVEIDDGDLDNTSTFPCNTTATYQAENSNCAACNNCTRPTDSSGKKTRKYLDLGTNRVYPN